MGTARFIIINLALNYKIKIRWPLIFWLSESRELLSDVRLHFIRNASKAQDGGMEEIYHKGLRCLEKNSKLLQLAINLMGKKRKMIDWLTAVNTQIIYFLYIWNGYWCLVILCWKSSILRKKKQPEKHSKLFSENGFKGQGVCV